jgi:hypothetical protein
MINEFVRLVQRIATDHGVRLQHPDIFAELDADGIEELKAASQEVRQSWAEAIALRLVLMRGIVPKGWDKTLVCLQCDPVYHYAHGQGESCPWCHVRHAGKPFPQP